jgi:hypothetical protein
MPVVTNPAPEVLTLKSYPGVDRAPDGSNHWAATGSLLHPSGMTTRQVAKGVSLKSLNITVSLNPSTSWVVKSHIADQDLLEHERLHYMAAVCVARKLHDDLMALAKPTVGALQGAMNTLHAEAGRRIQSISDKYDGDTDHGKNAHQQSTWAARVRGWYSSKKLTW